MKVPKSQKLLQSLLFDMRLKAFEKFLLLIVPLQPRNPDGSFQVSARQLAVIAKSTERTASKGLETLQNQGFIEIVREGSSSKGGYKIFFRNASFLAIMLVTLGATGALHNQNYADKSAQNTCDLHII